MHSTQGALAEVERDATLSVAGIQSIGCEFPLTKRAGEKAPVIRVPFQFDNERTGELCGRKDDGGGSPFDNALCA